MIKHICKECKTPVEESIAKKSHKEYGAVYCEKCRAAFDKAIADGLIEKDGKPEQPPEQVTDQSFNVEGKEDTCEVLSAPGAPSAPTGLESVPHQEVEFSPPEEGDASYEVVDDHEHTVTRYQSKAKPVATQLPELDLETIRKYINPKVTEREAYMFLMLCKSRGLNPFVGEVHLIKYGNEAATTVVGKDAFTRRGEESGHLDGFEAGIIVTNDKSEIIRRAGSLILEGETLIGGWGEVHRKDMTHPFESEVTLSEYIGRKKDGTVNKMWKTKPATMIRKVGLMQSFREAFPSTLGGVYNVAEMGIDAEGLE